MSKKSHNKRKKKNPDSHGNEAAYVKRLAVASYDALCEWFQIPEDYRIGLRQVRVVEGGVSMARPSAGSIVISLAQSRDAAEAEDISIYSDLTASGIHEVAHVFLGDHRRYSHFEVAEFEDKLEDEGRSIDEALCDGYIGVVIELSKLTFKPGTEFAETYPACAALAKPGVVRPVAVAEDDFMAEVLKSQHHVGCDATEGLCLDHQSAPIRAANTAAGRGLVWEMLAAEWEYSEGDDDDGEDDQGGEVDGGDVEPDDDDDNDDGYPSPVPTGPPWRASANWGRS